VKQKRFQCLSRPFSHPRLRRIRDPHLRTNPRPSPAICVTSFDRPRLFLFTENTPKYLLISKCPDPHVNPSTTTNLVCPECGCKNTVKKGKRRNRLQTLPDLFLRRVPASLHPTGRQGQDVSAQPNSSGRLDLQSHTTERAACQATITGLPRNCGIIPLLHRNIKRASYRRV
jgi:hypothetical protein